jgi:flagellar secretion chaperone FliS
MDPHEIASLYREVSARGNHPVGLVGKLYDAILEDFRRAMNAVAAGDIQRRTGSLNHALKIIAELQSVLDFERGGEVARRLKGLYEVTRPLIVEANLRSDSRHIQRLVDLYVPMRQAWRQVEQAAAEGKLGGNSENTRPQANNPAVPVTAAERASGAADPDAPSARWSA